MVVLEEARLIRSWNLALRLNSQNYNSWMVTYNPLHGHPQFQGWSPTFPKMVTHFQKDGHQPSPKWTPNIRRRITHHSRVGNPPTKGRPPTIIWMVTNCPKDMVTHHPQDGHSPTLEWSPTILGIVIPIPTQSPIISRMVNGQWSMDSCAAQLVILLLLGGFKKCLLSKISPVKSIWWGDTP